MYHINNSLDGCIAVSGTVQLSNININNNYSYKYIYEPGDNAYITTPKPKTFKERLEEEIEHWHGNILQEIKSYG